MYVLPLFDMLKDSFCSFSYIRIEIVDMWIQHEKDKLRKKETNEEERNL